MGASKFDKEAVDRDPSTSSIASSPDCFVGIEELSDVAEVNFPSFSNALAGVGSEPAKIIGSIRQTQILTSDTIVLDFRLDGHFRGDRNFR